MGAITIAQTGQPKLSDNKVLDEWRIPFGDWYDQSVDWIDNQFNDGLKATESFFEFFIDLVNEDILLAVPWIVVVIAFFFLGWLLQNIRIGVLAAVGLTICGLMGANYWPETARTIGYITVAVVLCCLIGIPVGILSGRIDSFWQTVRPLLDAMQVVHSFVYMLPFIYFFGIGPVSATIVTMVFAIPPVIRLTNLGIRQVPEDVVEASRAFGQTELQILKDVQLPLARPAIMTGINQTLLLSISMLGIAALMGAGGLGRLMFQALNNQDPALSGSAGLAFFLVAVVLDRLTQREGENTQSLWYRMRRAWGMRAQPEELLAEVESLAANADLDDPSDEVDANAVVYEPVDGAERNGIGVLGLGALVTLVSLFVTWNSGGGWFTSFVRRFDELGQAPARPGRPAGDVRGDSFNALQASGGSWFGYILVAAVIMVGLSILFVMIRPGNGPRWLNPDGAAIASYGALLMTLIYVLSSPAPTAVASSGSGSIIALVGTLIMAVGATMWALAARQEPLRPLPDRIMWPAIIGAVIAFLLVLAGGFSGWIFDERAEAIISDELQAQIDALVEEARDPETEVSRATAISVEIATVRAQAEVNEKIVTSGFSGDGPGSSIWLLVASLFGVAATAVAAGASGLAERRQWLAGTAAAGIGAGIFIFALGYIATLVRGTDPNIVSGVGVFFTLLAGAVLANAGRSVINEFRRSRVYPEIESVAGADIVIAADTDQGAHSGLVGVGGS